MTDRLTTAGLLFLSNLFMTVAWYGHLRFKKAHMLVAILASWGIALLWLGEGMQPKYMVSFGLIVTAVVVAFR